MSQQDQSQYFDLMVEGVGYLDRVRTVRPEGQEPFWTCSVAALYGKAGKTAYTYFDCIVSGVRAREAVKQLEPFVVCRQKVLIGFRLADPHAEAFIYDKGERRGRPGVSLKARLLSIRFAKVDGVEFPVTTTRSSRTPESVSA